MSADGRTTRPLATLLLAALASAAAGTVHLALAPGAASAAAAGAAAGAQEPGERRKLTPRQDAERRYADKLVQRGYQRMAASQWRAARADFEKAIESLEIAYGPNHPRIAELYVIIARTRYTQETQGRGEPGPMREARAEFARAIELYRAQPRQDPEKLLETLVQYADLLQVAGASQEAGEVYLEAWDVLIRDASLEAANNFFDKTVKLWSQPLRGRKSDAEQTVWLEFTVGRDGRVGNIVDRGSDAEAKVIDEVRDVLEGTRFRPRIVNGTPVESLAYMKLVYPEDGEPPVDVLGSG